MMSKNIGLGSISYDVINAFLKKVPTVIRDKGWGYERNGCVCFFSWNGDRTKLIAAVEGNELRPYQVVVSFNSSPISGSCTCPFWKRKVTCKHIVAVLYHALNTIPDKEKLELPCLDEFDDSYVFSITSLNDFYFGAVAKCTMRRQYSQKKSSFTLSKFRFFWLEILA